MVLSVGGPFIWWHLAHFFAPNGKEPLDSVIDDKVGDFLWFHIPKVIARINDAQYARVYEELGIDMVNSTELLASMIRNKITDSSSTSFILKDPRLDTMKIVAQDKSSGKRVEELSLPGESVIVAIVKNKNGLRIARPKDIINSGDLLIVVAKVESVAKVKKILRQKWKKSFG